MLSRQVLLEINSSICVLGQTLCNVSLKVAFTCLLPVLRRRGVVGGGGGRFS